MKFLGTHVLLLFVTSFLSAAADVIPEPEPILNGAADVTQNTGNMNQSSTAATDPPATPEPPTNEVIIVDGPNPSPDAPKPTDAELAELFKLPIGFFNPPSVTMLIILNSLGPSGGMLNVHCKSKDDDLGVHAKPFQVAFINTFTPNVWQTTLFFCHIWTDKFGSAHFDAYKAKRDFGRCSSACAWQATPNGIYGYKQVKNSKPLQDIFIPWSK